MLTISILAEKLRTEWISRESILVLRKIAQNLKIYSIVPTVRTYCTCISSNSYVVKINSFIFI